LTFHVPSAARAAGMPETAARIPVRRKRRMLEVFIGGIVGVLSFLSLR
jgi:hypothetical protein